MNKYKTEQEVFWAGKFGDEYIKRNYGKKYISANVALFSKILSHTRNVKSLIEFGANIGLNMVAIKSLMPKIKLSALEINKKACTELKKINDLKTYNQSVLDFKPTVKHDFVLTKGVLTHLNPEMLNKVYDIFYKASRKYICVAEYYNQKPVEESYRGFRAKLFKRDFAGEMLDRFKKLGLVAYGFAYYRDNNFSFGDTHWFLLEK